MIAQSLESTWFHDREQEKSRLLSSQRKKHVLCFVFCVGLLWYDLVVIEGGEGGFVDVFYAGLLEFDAVSAV